MPKPSLLKLFWIFFKIGMVLFGGGYAILPFLKSEICEKEKICTMEELTDYYAISQCFPGLVAGNVSMFIGHKARGTKGALFCLWGICLPAFLAIVLIFSFLSHVIGNPFVNGVFEVLDIAVCVLIFLTIIELWKFAIIDKFSAILFAIATFAAIYNVSPFIIVISAGLIGVLKHLILNKEMFTSCKTSNNNLSNKGGKENE